MHAPSTAPATGFQRLAMGAAAVGLLVVAVGGAVRATDSGLACPTWPGCFSAADFVPAPDFNVWLEHSHRLVAGTLALLIAATLLWTLRRFRHRPELLWPAVVAAVAVNIQALLGAAVVWLQLRAELVTAHLGLAMAIVGCLLYIAVSVTRPPLPAAERRRRDLRLARSARNVAALALLQILVGGHVTGINAGLAYAREGSAFSGLLAFAPVASEAHAYNVLHRVLALALVVAVVVLLRRVRAARAGGAIERLAVAATALVGVQILIGVANVTSGLSFLAVIPHLAVASWIWASLALLTLLAYRSAPLRSVPEATPEAAQARLAEASR